MSAYDRRPERSSFVDDSAFATIVMVWMLAFGIDDEISAQIGAQSHHVADSAASIEK